MKKTITTMAALAAVLWLQAGSATAQAIKPLPTKQNLSTGKQNKPKSDINVYFSQQDSTWVYEITLDGKPYIRQSFLPGEEGYQKITSSQDAYKLASLAKRKFDTTGDFPFIKSRELDSLSILKKF